MSHKPVKGNLKSSDNNAGKDVLEHLRSMQQMEKDTQSTLEKFMSALSQHAQTDYAGMLEEKIRELQAASEEIRRLGNEVLRNEERINELTIKEQKATNAQGLYIEEQMKSAKALSQSDQVIKKLQAQMVSLQQKHQQDMDIKATTLRALEEDSLRSKVQADEAHSRMESMSLEAAELHSAMASLHGEIAAQQRELDEFQEREQRSTRQKKEMMIRIEEKDVEIGRLKVDRRSIENRLADLEKKLSDAALHGDQIQHEASSQVEQLVRERENVQGSLAKMSFKLKQQTGTQKELNALLSRMRLELAAAQDSVTMEKTRADAAERDVSALQIVVSSLEKSKIESDIMIHRAEQEKACVQSDLQQLSDNHSQLLSEQRKASVSIDRLERERTELTIDLSGRVKDIESMKKIIESLQIEQEELRAKVDHERMAKERSLESNGILDGELDRLKSDLREFQENADSMSRQLRESERMREQALEVSRAQQRENANRIIEFSQKNSKLTSELSAKDDEIAMLRRNREEVLNQGQDSIRERDDYKQQYFSARARLQSLEDQNEEAVARLESSKSEVEELRLALRREIASREQLVSTLNQKHEESIASLTARLETEAEEKVVSAIASRKQTEERLERAMVKEKESHQQQFLDLQGQRQQDADMQRARLGTLAKAMEGLQVELREEVNKNSVLSQELAVLKDLAEVGSGEMQERINYIERERLRDRNRLEGQLADVKEQLRQQIEQKQQRDQLMSTIEQQLSRERESRFSALQRVRAAEDEASNLASQVDTLVEENANSKKLVRDHERKLALAIQAKDSELARLTRRNEVLGEAVTRLTAAQQGGSSSSLSNGANLVANPVSRYFTSVGAKQSSDTDIDGMDSPLNMEALSLNTPMFSTGSVSSSLSSSRARTAPTTRRFVGSGTDDLINDDLIVDDPVNPSHELGSVERRSTAPAGATRTSVTSLSAASSVLEESPPPSGPFTNAWQDTFTNASPLNSQQNINRERQSPDIGDQPLAQMSSALHSRPESPVVTESPNSPLSISNNAGPSSGSIFKHKLNISVSMGKGHELLHSPAGKSNRSIFESDNGDSSIQATHILPNNQSPKKVLSLRTGAQSVVVPTKRPLSGSGTRKGGRKGPVF